MSGAANPGCSRLSGGPPDPTCYNRSMRKAFLILAIASTVLSAASRPKIRAITAFLDLDAKTYDAQIRETVQFLNSARDAYRAAGFEVEGIRIATQPFARYTAGMSHDEALTFLQHLQDLASQLRFAPSIGPAMVGDGDDPAAVDLLIDILSKMRFNASLVIAGEDGIHWNAIKQAARLVKQVSIRSTHSQGNFNFAAIAMVAPNGPFYPGAYHLGGPRAFAVGFEAANVVEDVFKRDRDPKNAEKNLAAALAGYTREAESVATRLAQNSGWTYAGIDPTPAPMGDVSIARAMEAFTGAPFGSSGTMTAAAIITRAVQATPVKHTGYTGLMVPVLEDNLLAKRWAEGTYTIDSLLAYSAVCAGGLDTVPLPGDTTEDQLARIYGDVATLAYKWHKPLAARLLPVAGKKSGDRTEFQNNALMNTTIR